MAAKVAILAAVASLFLFAAVPGQAHPVAPAELKIGREDGALTLALELDGKPLAASGGVAGLPDFAAQSGAIPLAGPTPAGDAGAPPRLEMPPGMIAAAKAALKMKIDGHAVALELTGQTLRVPPGPKQNPRGFFWFRTALPAGARTAEIAWSGDFGSLLIRQTYGPAPFTATLASGETSAAFDLGGGSGQSGWQVFADYVPIGFEHILPKGLDHILFVLGLFLLAVRMRPLLWQITAFTAAHTVSLALGSLGYVNVPASIVEPLIAASICYVAIENVFTDHLTLWRPMVVFGFGLLHGLGFASVLGQFGLPKDHFIPALLGFNAGVELGQLTVVAVAFLAVGAWFRHKPWYRARITIPASLAIAAVGAFWVVQRTVL